MKKIVYTISLLSIIYSCAGDVTGHVIPDLEPNKARLIGHITNYTAADSIKEIEFYTADVLEGTLNYKTTIDSLGNFRIDLPAKEPKDYRFYYKTTVKLILKGGEEIKLTFDAKDTISKMFYNSAIVSGAGSNPNRNLFKYLGGNPVNLSQHYRQMYSLSPDSFKKFHDSVLLVEKRYADKFLKEISVSQELENWIQIHKNYGPSRRLLGYNINQRMYKSGQSKPFELPEEYYSDLKNLPRLLPEHLINSELSREFINYYVSYLEGKIRKETGKTSDNIDSIVIQNIMDAHKDNPLLAQLLVNKKLTNTFRTNDLAYYNKNKILFEEVFGGSFFEALHKNKIEEIKELLTNPVLPEKTELMTFNTKDSSKFLDEIITNANGKVIYIDNWATWCGPCKREFKTGTPEMKAKFGDQIEFVYLCYRSKEELWKPIISQYKIEGKHYFIEDGKDQDLDKQLSIKGFPTYTLINKKGEIVKSGFEYRPSLTSTSALLAELISEEE